MADGNPELDNLLLILSEHPHESENLVFKILSFFPWGYSPSLYIEKMHDPQKRMVLRDSISLFLFKIKQLQDLELLLQNPHDARINEKGAFLLSCSNENMNYSYNEFAEKLDLLAAPLEKKFQSHDNITEKNKIKIFVQYFFRELAFCGEQENSQLPDNFIFQKVLDSKKGGAIHLCVLANAIASRAGIELPVVITAGHFLLRTKIENEIPFIDPLQNGRIVSEQEHMSNVAAKGYDPSIALLHIYSPFTLFQNLARNLIHVYQTSQNNAMLENMREIRGLLKNYIDKNS